MKEVRFIAENKEKWEVIEAFLEDGSGVAADDLAETYIQLTDDLSFARTFYPGSNLVVYLNQLAINVHQKIYINKKERQNRLKSLFLHEIPDAVFRHRRQLLYALLLFTGAILIGWFSAFRDQSYVRTIMGDTYVNMTLENIDKNDPMAVYGTMREGGMFVFLSVNNIRVALLAFGIGIFTSIATGFVLFSNGIMVGSFLQFFAQKSLLGIALSTIMIHGALELSAIVIAGAAGFILGNSYLFPGTYPRRQALVMGAKDSLKIMIGLMPIILIAAFLEGFVTRHYLAMGAPLRYLVILLSLAFIIWYFILYPRKKNIPYEQPNI